MARINLLPKFTVKVEGGSGCLFQPIDDEYSYVLTAKHVISGNNAPSIIRQTLDENNNQIYETLQIIGTPFRHSDENKDAAIIKVQKVEEIDSLLRDELSSEYRDGYYLCGHPKSRINDGYSFRENKLEIQNKKQYGYVEAELSRVANRTEIVGQSGGGVIKIEDSCFLLAGIQKQMSAPDGIEQLGRIDFMPLTFFDEIIEENANELSKLFPPYIASFERLLNEIFPLPNLIAKRSLIQNELKRIAAELCNDFSPTTILEMFGEQFLIYGTEKSIIHHKQLWLSFLEILSINQLHNLNKISLEDLKELHKKRKLFIVDTDKWTKKIEDIYKTNLSDIEKGGAIVICATNETEPSKTEISSEELIILDISTPFEKDNISNTVRNPFKELRLMNIFKFQSHIINNALAYAQLTLINSNEVLRNTTNGVI
ncbi:MAG: ABC-three component system protein [Bacteroidota bacterium]